MSLVRRNANVPMDMRATAMRKPTTMPRIKSLGEKELCMSAT